MLSYSATCRRTLLLANLANFIRNRPFLRRCAHATVRLIPDWPYTLRTAELGPVRIRMRRHRHLLWEHPGQGDELTLGMFQRLIREGDVVFDIGANIGLYARIMVQRFQAGSIIAFEPMADNYDLLESNVQLGKLQDRVTLYRMALSDVEGEEELQIDDMTSGTAVLTSVSEGRASVGRQEFGLVPITEIVKIMRLDDLIIRDRLPPPGFVKIDTEGAEVKVLEGAMETLRRHKPRLCIALHAEDKARGTLEALDELGYLTFGHAEIGGWRQIHASDASRLANNNIIASFELSDVQREIEPYRLCAPS